tara:strand:- start:1170 stop:1628 length:459 start_codon:yes stop_codon:yes gene_type:complete
MKYDVIHKFDLNIDRELLLDELPITKEFSELNPKWRKSYELGKYGTNIRDVFRNVYGNNFIRAGYYFQPEGIPVLEHIDDKAKCCINVNLTNDPTPIIINDEKVYYDCALINVGSYRHSVPKAISNRIIFRIVFFYDTFINVLKRIKNVGSI